MCFIAVAVAVHPSFPFVVAANRDEAFDRPAA
ncbi:MAG: NRDE protein, partial [Acidiferrobacteraceae bacterium]|nr:NRDE protein [Acidiferrobacteraceae bacterium]